MQTASEQGLHAVELAVADQYPFVERTADIALRVPTLKRAISGESALLDRLGKLDETVMRLAKLIGGPVPVSSATGIAVSDTAQSSSLMERINDLNDACHARVSDIEHSFAAMCRALGAEE